MVLIVAKKIYANAVMPDFLQRMEQKKYFVYQKFKAQLVCGLFSVDVLLNIVKIYVLTSY